MTEDDQALNFFFVICPIPRRLQNHREVLHGISVKKPTDDIQTDFARTHRCVAIFFCTKWGEGVV